MTQDEIIEMARQAGFDVKEWGDETLVRTVHSKGYFVVINQKLEAFAKLVAEKEREECAKIIYDSWESTTAGEGIPEDWLLTLAELIKARGN